MAAVACVRARWAETPTRIVGSNGKSEKFFDLSILKYLYTKRKSELK